MDPTERFSVTVDDYRRYRPDYPTALFDWLQEALPAGAEVIDVGAGTGISSRQLASYGFKVVGVEPNEAMRRAAESEAPIESLRYVDGSAQSLPFDDASVEALLGFQCFHWFDYDLALVEMRRVLCPGGPCIAVWNLRDHADPAMSAYEAILKEHAPEYESVGAEPAAEKLLAHPLAQLQETRAFAHSQHFDRKGLHGRCWSSSYVRHSVKDPEALNQALDALFDKFAEQESFRFSYVTKAFSLSL